MGKVRVAILGASGETGSLIVDGLLLWKDPEFEVVALTRPQSCAKPVNQELKRRGVKIAPVDLSGSLEHIIEALSGVEVVISAVPPVGSSIADQNRLAEAAKAANIARFVPTAWATPAARGIIVLRDEKEKSIDYIQQMKLPYTVIDVGWWHQGSVPKLPSGKTSYARLLGDSGEDLIPGDGHARSALTDSRQLGEWVARIITDPRTLNKRVFCYDEVLTRNELLSIVESLSGEQVQRKYISEDELRKKIDQAQQQITNGDTSFLTFAIRSFSQYDFSLGIRGDNTPENAEYLGYIDGRQLYPEMGVRTFADFFKEVLAGKAKRMYENSEWATNARETLAKSEA